MPVALSQAIRYRGVKKRWEGLALFHNFAFETLLAAPELLRRKSVGRKVLTTQIYFTGVQALTITFIIGFLMGGSILALANSYFENVHQIPVFYTILIALLTTATGSIITAFLVIARSGPAIASELGNMVINDEVDALVSMGISPISYLVVPRVIAVAFSVITLSIYLSVAGFLGSGITAQLLFNITFADFYGYLFSEFAFSDVLIHVVKAAFLGIFIGLICCFHGLRAGKVSTQIPKRTLLAVVYSLVSIFVMNVILSLLFSVFSA